MEERKWENLSSDCLVNIFKRLDLEMLLLDVPLVCKHWYQTLLNPLCWQKLVFPFDYTESRLENALEDEEESVPRAIKFVVRRSQGCAITLVFPIFTTLEGVMFVLKKCPALKFLAVPCYTLMEDEEDIIGAVLGDPFVQRKSKDLLTYRNWSYILQIIDKICLHSKNFVGLSVKQAHITNMVASTIVSKLATIKCLVLNNAVFEEEEHLEMILLGGKELEVMYVRNCVGFDEDNKHILGLDSRIKDFRCEGSKAFCYEEDYKAMEFLPFPDYILNGDW
ncbi:hypothetical protein POM88_028560 [Heracleum sosnowskyi]|uniref:F-box domain-containing protein n=1 Tax=Heracleum sosnowskyi TaxID=360622 RepID=A0AAD8HS22_9APIA|nr:hypothetical protein POM88_028560 [Heracleum sosnowskyi]